MQNLDYLFVCTEKFVDSVLNCSGGGNVGRMDKSLGCLGKTPWDILTHLWK